MTTYPNRPEIITALLECLAGPAALTTREAAAIQDAITILEADAQRIVDLEALSVTNILIDVVPGDGSGVEVFAKSTRDVEDLLTTMCEKIEDFESSNWAQHVAVPQGNWLWCKLMDFCKKRGVAPASFDDLFAIVAEAREAQQIAASATLTEGEIVGLAKGIHGAIATVIPIKELVAFARAIEANAAKL